MTEDSKQVRNECASALVPETRKITSGGGSLNSGHALGGASPATGEQNRGGANVAYSDDAAWAESDCVTTSNNQSSEHEAASAGAASATEAGAALKKLRLSAAQIRVLGIIAAAGGALLTKDELADMAQCSKKTVDRAITRLTRDGLVQVCAHFASDGAQLANEYRIPAFSTQQPNSAAGPASGQACADFCVPNAAAP